MALTFNMQFETELRKIVSQKRDEVLSKLEIAGGVDDYAAYREQVGYLRALGDMGDWCNEVSLKLEQR